MIDGMTGSGKSTIIKATHAWAHSCEHRVFSLSTWDKDEPPLFEDISDYDVYFTYEPTRSWIGRAIRYELSRSDTPYGGQELAHAFALDRQIMYRRLIIPALAAGKTVIQDRGVSSSLVYQPVMPDSVPLETVQALPGNTLALKYAPDALILTKVPASVAHARIQARSDDSKGVFADLTFLQKQEERFHSPWLADLFKAHGSQIHTLDTSGELATTEQAATDLIDHLLNTC